VCAEALYLRAAASAPVALAAASASSAPPVLSAMFGSRLFDQRVLRLVAQGLGLSPSALLMKLRQLCQDRPARTWPLAAQGGSCNCECKTRGRRVQPK